MTSRSAIRQVGPEPAPWSLSAVVDAICQANGDLLRGRDGKSGRRSLPSREAVAAVVSGLRAALFPWHFGASDMSGEGLAYYVGRTLDASLAALDEQVRVGLLFDCQHGGEPCDMCPRRATEVVRELAARLPALRETLGSDARAAYEGDPAATSPDETIFSYAGMTAITYHRIAHELHLLGVPLIPRIISELAHAATGIDIHPGAQIGPRFFIDHGTGVVIGETCTIGAHVRLYQGVTLGAKSFPTDDHGNPVKGIQRHPIVEDDVIIYAGATVLGRITVGRGSTVGGNVWLTKSIAPGTHVTQAQLRHEDFNDGSGI
jgi:serine O-acetyltransferase